MAAIVLHISWYMIRGTVYVFYSIIIIICLGFFKQRRH